MSTSEYSEDSQFEEYIFSGKILNNSYILIDKIGSGTFATVWSCYDIKTKNYLAIKIQDMEEHDCAMDELTFHRTMLKGGNVGGAHNYISTMLDFFVLESDYGSHDCFVFHLAACSTYDIIRYIKYSKNEEVSPLSLLNIKRIIYQTLLAIKSINDNYNLLHTDVRAENILVMGSDKKLDLFKSIFDFKQIEKLVSLKKKKFIKKYKKKKLPIEIETQFYEESSIGYIQKILEDERFLEFKSNDSDDDNSHNNKDSESLSSNSGSESLSVSISTSNSGSNSNNCKTGLCTINNNNDNIASVSGNCNDSAKINHNLNKPRYEHYDSFHDLDEFINEVPSDEIIYDKEINSLSIDTKYLNKIQIRLADFGSACFSDKKYNMIQARHYRAPEVVIGYPFNESCDIWSLGCLLFELITGDVLFKPNKSPYISRNKHHLYKMYQLLGPIPNNMIEKCKYRKIFFNHDYTLKIDKRIVELNMFDFIRSEINSRSVKIILSDDELNQMIEFLMLTFEYDPEKRSKAGNLINHKWFDDIKINIQ